MMKKILFLAILLIVSLSNYAQIDGTIDASFDPGTGANSTIFETAIQSDGKIIIGGMFTNFNGISRNHIARLNVDGTLDSSFNPGTGAGGSDVSTISR